MTRQAGGVASLTKPPIESRLVKRLAVLGRQERVAVNAYHVACGDGLGERRMDRHVYLHAGLDLFNGEHVVDDAMPPKLADIAATLAGVEEEREQQALARADWPARLELRDLFLAKEVVAVALGSRDHDAGTRVGLDQPPRHCPPREFAHGDEPGIGDVERRRIAEQPIHVLAVKQRERAGADVFECAELPQRGLLTLARTLLRNALH